MGADEAGHGLVERLNKTFTLTLAHYLRKEAKAWDQYTPWAQLVHNASPHEALTDSYTTGLAPSEVFLGRKLNTWLDQQLGRPVQQLSGATPQEQAEAMKEYAKLVKEHVTKVQEGYHDRMERTRRNRQRSRPALKVGELVKLRRRLPSRKLAKVLPGWRGPYRIIEAKEDGVTYIIKHVAAAKGKPAKHHIDNLMRWITRPGVPLLAAEQPPEEFDEEEFEVEQILAQRHTVRGAEYLVQWKNWDGDPTWEPEEHLSCPEKLEDFLLTQSASKVAAALQDNKPKAQTLKLDLMELGADTLMEEVCARAGYNLEDVVAIIASPPCHTYSVADASNQGKMPQCHFRDHNDPEHPPRKDGTWYAQVAKRADDLVKHILHAWHSMQQRGYSGALAMENPWASLARRPFMAPLTTMLGMVRHGIHYCAFGHLSKKATHWWSTPGWVPQGSTGTGLCQCRCPHGYIDPVTGRWRHAVGLGRQHALGYTGKGAVAKKNAVPHKMLTEWLRAAVKAHSTINTNRGVVIDLCAGWQSMRGPALGEGYDYVAVDIVGRRDVYGNQDNCAAASTSQERATYSRWPQGWKPSLLLQGGYRWRLQRTRNDYPHGAPTHLMMSSERGWRPCRVEQVKTAGLVMLDVMDGRRCLADPSAVRSWDPTLEGQGCSSSSKEPSQRRSQLEPKWPRDAEEAEEIMMALFEGD